MSTTQKHVTQKACEFKHGQSAKTQGGAPQLLVQDALTIHNHGKRVLELRAAKQ